MTFIEKSILKYGNTFTYSNTTYVNSKTKVIITCPIHGDFTIIPNNFLSSKNRYGCTKCGNVAKGNSRKTAKIFTKEATTIHNNIYNYDKVIYVNSHTKVTITCPIHGDFTQAPYSHLAGHGCDSCARERNSISSRMSIKQDNPITLYYIHVPELSLWKIGCTKNLAQRFIFSQFPYKYNLLHSEEFEDSREAYFIEGWLLRHTTQYKVTDYTHIKGYTELRSMPIHNLSNLIAQAKKEYSIDE